MDFLKFYVFNVRPEELSVLKRLDIDMVFLANNHSMDYGKKGLEQTIENLTRNEIRWVGAGKDIKEAYSAVPIELENWNGNLFSVSAIGEQRLFATNNSPGAALYSVPKLTGLVKPFSGKWNLLSIHWGIEYRPEPLPSQIKDAHALIDAGFKIIIGHHPHIPQGIEKYKDGLIIYSLGNFLFGSRNQYLNHNLAVILHFEDNKFLQCEVIPIFGKFQKADHLIYPLEPEQGDEYLQEIQFLSKKLGTEMLIKNGRGYIKMR